MKLNILSDLHLSLGALAPPKTGAEVVILAGDIARPREAIRWASTLAKPVLYVAGNHEFYGGSIPGTVAELKALCAGTAIRVLDNDEVVIDGVRFLGTTLWTDFRLFGDGDKRAAAMLEALRTMRDYSRIRLDDDSGALLTPESSAALFALHAGWLERKLAEPHPGPTVVITHHAPSKKSIHRRYAGSLLNACFVADVERLAGADRVQLWVHGHTHDSFDYQMNGTRVVCNPRGYAQNGVDENPQFDARYVVEVRADPPRPGAGA
ncbi:MAG TPA: metallophosphoesterase [Casimicrobiaceae bacterium]|nr:metallophosphoesterase [Casimicrobiaceae bacterium]